MWCQKSSDALAFFVPTDEISEETFVTKWFFSGEILHFQRPDLRFKQDTYAYMRMLFTCVLSISNRWGSSTITAVYCGCASGVVCFPHMAASGLMAPGIWISNGTKSWGRSSALGWGASWKWDAKHGGWLEGWGWREKPTKATDIFLLNYKHSQSSAFFAVGGGEKYRILPWCIRTWTPYMCHLIMSLN